MKVSESYRGFDIYYEHARRRWLVELGTDTSLVEFNAAFQARRAINVALDGHSETWPKRERSSTAGT